MNQSDISNILENAWLGLGDVSKLDLKNPLLRTEEDKQNPGLTEARLMRNAEYLTFASKTLLDIDLIPLQSAILEELWIRSFPLYIASRGQSKSFTLGLYTLLKCVLYDNMKVVIVGAAFRQSKVIFEYMEHIWRNAPVLRSVCDNNSGPRRDVDRCTFRINNSQAIAIPVGCLGGGTFVTTENGIRTISDVCNNKSDNQILSNGEFRNIGYYLDNGVQPVKKIRTKRAYEYIGTYNHKMKVVRNNDIIWCRTDELQVGDAILIDRAIRWYNNVTFSCTADEAYVLGCTLESECLPNTILSASKENVAACISGLIDSGGDITGGKIYFYSTNHKLLQQVQYVLLHFGIISGVIKESDSLCICGNNNLRLFYDYIGVRSANKQAELNSYIHNVCADVVSNIYYDQIVDIQDIEDCNTYDLNVPDNSEYRANGFFSHNTGEKIRGLRANIIISDEFNCTDKNTIVETDDGLVRISDLMDRNDFCVINQDGVPEQPHNNIITPPCDVYEVKTQYGYSFRCSENHIVMTQNGWKRLVDLKIGDILVSENKYQFPQKDNYPLTGYNAYILGQNFDGECVPNIILAAPKNVVQSFIIGFFGGNTEKYILHQTLASDIQILLRKLDIDSIVSLEAERYMIKVLRSNNPDIANKIVSITKLEEQDVLYDFYLPQTHSFYGNGFVQHNSIPPDIYETVISGFAAVSADPVSSMKEVARRKEMAKLGIWTTADEENYHNKMSNQAILSGTAGYNFQHFYDYWKRYSSIIRSRGDKKKLAEVLGVDEVPESFNWKDYAVIRVPYELIPEGFMDDKVVSRAKATMNSAIYGCEYGACFATDSDGFFKRSMIERCIANDKNNISFPSSDKVTFDAQLAGSSAYRYIYGIDPASERDNFSIVVLELHDDHSRIVYCWSTNRKDFKRRIKAGLVDKADFYGFCARKIRELMKVFPCEAIAMDAQGGGVAVEEALHDPDKMEMGEVPIWPVIDKDKPKDTDLFSGKHILHLCQFAKGDWTAEANHGLRKDFEDRVLLFPRFDTLTLELSAEEDGRRYKDLERAGKKVNIYDTLEDCVLEIEELKDELCTITLTRTGTGVNARDRWDTPEVKQMDGKKGRLRKDRYSALVMANMIARNIHRAIPDTEYSVIGGFARTIDKNQEGQMYNGPEWFTQSMNDGVIFGINRKGR